MRPAPKQRPRRRARPTDERRPIQVEIDPDLFGDSSTFSSVAEYLNEMMDRLPEE